VRAFVSHDCTPAATTGGQ